MMTSHSRRVCFVGMCTTADQGIAPAPWRTAPRYPQPEEDVDEESEDSEAEAAAGTDPPPETKGKDTRDDAGAHGDDGSGERQRRGLWWGGGGNKIEEDQGGAARDLPGRFIPASGFYDAPSVRFVFTAKLNPPAARGRRKRNKGNSKSNSKGGDQDQGQGQGQHRLDEVKSQKEGGGGEGGDERGRRRELLWHRWNRGSRRGSGGQDDTDGSLFVKMETGWTPLTRIREEHAPMPAPETKCMQVCVCACVRFLNYT